MEEEKKQEGAVSGMTRLYRQYLYYFIIGIVSFVSLVFLPMLGSTAELGFNIPQTQAAWVVFISTRIAVSFINVLIFHSFMEQGKLNIQDNEDYKHANEILKNVKEARVKQALSPHKWLTKEYSSKGVSIFVSSMLATFAISQAILSYDWITLISYALTIGSAIVFGVLQMKKAEMYWTVEYPQYAADYEEKFQAKQRAIEMAEKEPVLIEEKPVEEPVAEESEKDAEKLAEEEILRLAKEEEERKAKEAEQKRLEEEARKKAEEEARKKAEKEKRKAEYEAALAELNKKFNMEEEKE